MEMENRFRYLLVVGVLLQLLSWCFNDFVTSKSLAIAPLAIGAFAASAGAALNSMINNQNKKNAEYSMELQKDLMDYSWRKYNSPSAQAKAYSDAGFNPAVAFGQGGMSSPVAPNVSAPELNQIGMSSSMSDLGTLVSTGSQALLAAAEAKKVGLEAEGQKLVNDYNAKTLEERVRSVALQNNWTSEQTAKVTQEIGLLSGQFNEIQQRIENMRSEKELTDKQVSWYDRNISAEIDDLKASAKYKNAVAGLTDSQKQLLDDTMEDLKNITSLNRQQMEKIVSLLDKYGDAQAIVGMLSQIVGSASDLIGSISSFKNIGKTVETITGSTTQKSDGSWSTTNIRTTRK